MRRPLPLLLFLPAISLLLPSFVAAEERVNWIWSIEPRDAPSKISITKSITIDGEIESAILRAAADFSGFELTINGQPAASLEPYEDHVEKDIRRILKSGENRIEITADGVAGPSAIAVQLDVVLDGGKKISFASGDDWMARPFGTKQKPSPVATFGKLAALRWRDQSGLPDIGAFDEYNQWKEALGAGKDAAAATFSKLPDGFEIELLRVANDDEGSWVSMAFDAKGRIILAREKRGLLRATISEDGKSISDIEVIDDSLLECRGLLFAHDSLYANANNSKALHRLRDTNGDDTFDSVTKLKATGGGVGHGRNDLALGPDGMIYLIHGDSVQVPADATIFTSPTVEKFRNEGHLVRTDAEGEKWEIVSSGLRNPFGIDFNPDGEAFTYDADNESDIGLPFYRPTRVNHLISGADYGWRQSGQSWPVHAPDSLPTSIDIGHGSPTAVKFGTRSHFPNKYRNALFILDWAYGRIIAVDTIPRGASYTCRAESFLRGRPLNVTDLDFGPDGAMYFVTGGRKTRSALYRVRYTGPTGQPVGLTKQENARIAFSEKARELRHSLEKFHGQGQPAAALGDIWANLDHPDPWIRHAARTALEHQPVERWQDRALTEPPSRSATTALLALSRVGPDDVLPKVVERLLPFDFPKVTLSDQLSVLRSYEICQRRKCPIGGEISKKIVGQIGNSFPSQDPRLNRELARMLIALGIKEAIPVCLHLLAKSESQPDQLFYLDVLSQAAENRDWSAADREAFFRFLKKAQTFTGDRSLPGFIKAIRERALSGLNAEHRKALAHVIEWERDIDDAPAIEVPDRKVVKNWSLSDLAEIAASPAKDRGKSIERGEKIFASALCSRCHQMGATGTPAAPNLTAVSSRFATRDILKSIIEPSAVVAEIYQNHVVTKKDGTVIIGRVIQNNLRESTFTLAPNPFAPWVTETVSKNDITKHEISPASPMPAALLNTFSLEEIRDLVTFLEAGGNRKSGP